MALTKYAKRFVFGAQSDELTPQEAGFFSVAEQLGSLGDGRRCVLRFSRTAPAGMREDAAQIDFEFINFSAGVVDNTWIDADFTALEGYIDTWWTAVKAVVSSTHILDEFRWYKFGPSLPLSAKGNEEPGPPVRVTDRNVAGASTFQALPTQVAMSVTFKTPVRKRWGRFYLPGVDASRLDANARWLSATRTTVGAATDALIASASTNDFAPIVYSPTKRAAFGISAVQIDDVPDVIRSRRLRETGARTIYNT